MGIMNRLQYYYGWLTRDPLGFIIYLFYFSICILMTLVFHEVAHGYVAWRCGDPTAKMLGRLSLDPRKHLDPIGTICIVFLGFGWAKPVPVNPRNFRNYRRDDFFVSIAGIAVNFMMFLLAMSLAIGVNGLLWKPEFVAAFDAKYFFSSRSNIVNDLLMGENLSEFMRYPWLQHVQRFLLLLASMNLSIAIFNFLPIPPLDGFRIFNDILLKGRLQLTGNMFQVVQVILMVLIFSGTLSGILTTIVSAVESGVLNVLLMIAGKA